MGERSARSGAVIQRGKVISPRSACFEPLKALSAPLRRAQQSRVGCAHADRRATSGRVRQGLQAHDRSPSPSMLDHSRRHPGERSGVPWGRSRRFPRSSFTHLIHLYLTQSDDLQLETANRLVPCKHKGIRGFSETFGNDQIKARTFSRSLVQMQVISPSGNRGRPGISPPCYPTGRSAVRTDSPRKALLEPRYTRCAETTFRRPRHLMAWVCRPKALWLIDRPVGLAQCVNLPIHVDVPNSLCMIDNNALNDVR